MFRIPVLSLALVLGSVLAAPAAEVVAPGAGMAAAARDFVSALDDSQKKRACLPFASDERENWAFVPKERAGIPLAALTPPQQDLVRKLLASALSDKGLLKVNTIVTLETLLGEIEKRPEFRDAAKYHTTIFGEPGSGQPWAWRFEGHHVSVNLTLVPGKGISATPSFLGANPAAVRDGPKQGTRPLAAEEDLARALATALHRAGHKVIFSGQAPADILTAADRKARQLDPVGIAVADMTAGQKQAMAELIKEYAYRFRAEVARDALQRIDAGFDTVRFGWAGSLQPGEAYYYRIQGKSFLIEAANSQNKANHIHTVWRDPANDFGRDSLGEHLQDHDHPH